MEDEKKTFTGMKENHIEGRNAVLEAFPFWQDNR